MKLSTRKDFIKEHKTAIATENVMQSIEKESKDNVDNAVQEVMDYLKEHPEYAETILKEILERKDIPNAVFQEAAKEISTSEEIPDRVITKAVENSSINVPDSIISNILEDGEVNKGDSIGLIKNIDDVKIKQKSVLRQLKRIYADCASYARDEDVLSKIDELSIVAKDEQIDELERKIIAKRMANNYSKYGFTKISVFTNYIAPEEMLEINLPEIVGEEFKKIKNNKREFDEASIAKLILNNVRDKGEVKEIPLNQLLNNKEYLQIFQDMANAGMLDTLNSIPTEDRKKYITAMQNIISKRVQRDTKTKDNEEER